RHHPHAGRTLQVHATGWPPQGGARAALLRPRARARADRATPDARGGVNARPGVRGEVSELHRCRGHSSPRAHPRAVLTPTVGAKPLLMFLKFRTWPS